MTSAIEEATDQGVEHGLHFYEEQAGLTDRIESFWESLTQCVEHRGAFGSGAEGDLVEVGLFGRVSAASAFGDVEQNGEGGPVELIPRGAPPPGKATSKLDSQAAEAASFLVDDEPFVIEAEV